jgi:lipopolysaccharide/colanic/teichoic acid biosynthesis glycosyltransferase
MNIIESRDYGRVRAVQSRKAYRVAKRVLDLALCLLSLPLTLPLMLLVAVAIVIDSPGAPVFVQVRTGRRGRPFKIYKFRTMQSNHDDRADRAYMQAYISGNIPSSEMPTQPHYKPNNGSHITRVGRLLRKTSLDELPQILNVLRGEMSVVGPRPNVPWEADVYQWWHEERLSVPPGITGLAQIRGRSNLSFDSIARYDIYYVRNRSLELDLQILWWTVLAVFSGKEAD